MPGERQAEYSAAPRTPRPAEVRTWLADQRASLRARFETRPRPAVLLRQHCRVVDAALRTLWNELDPPRYLALVAVGGYGRRELFPCSDVDILVLLPGQPGPEDTVAIERLIGRLWDAGIEAAHSARTLAECVEESRKDITVQTTLLESRWIAGSRRLFLDLVRSMRSGFEAQAFFNAKLFEQEQRHARHQESAFHLEPNIKEAPGGLRDLQVILWISRASGTGLAWSDLARRGLITAREARQLGAHLRLLQHLRIALHYAAGRREDRLLFDYQDVLAARLRLRATPHRRASELLMQRYFRTAKAVTQLNTIVLQNLRRDLFPDPDGAGEIIDDSFRIVGGLLDARDPDLFERQPEAILHAFLAMQRRGDLKGMTATTLRALWRARRRIDGAFRRSPSNRALFLSILDQPRGIVHELRRMNQYGILGRYLPAFRRIVGQMQHDLFHVYTVDQHILTVVRNLRRFTMVEHAHEYPTCSRLITAVARPALLYVAAIFHDIAKGRGGDHSLLGAAEARRFCLAHGLSSAETGLVAFLVEHHLLMSSVAQKQDISDPDTVRRFAETVGSEERLVALYLLTVADIRGTSPRVWNAWRGKLLEDLLDMTMRTLKGDRSGASHEFQDKQAEAMRLLRLAALSDGVQDSLWRELDVAYFLRHQADEIAWQTRHLHFRVNGDRPVVKARLSPAGEGLQVMIFCRDQPELFARICGFFGALAFSIVDAKIHTTRHGYALDTFQVMGSADTEHHRDLIPLVEHDLAEQIAGQAPLPAPAVGRVSRQLRHFPLAPEVHIAPDESGQFYLLSIVAGDRPGLLYRIALVLSRYRVGLHTAKIATLGERAEDVLVISGEALQQQKTVVQLESDVLEALRP